MTEKIEISRDVLGKIRQHVLDHTGLESAGLLFGFIDVEIIQRKWERMYTKVLIKDFVPFPDCERSVGHFVLDNPVSVIDAIEKNRYDLVGTFHSHPSTAVPRPSQTDLDVMETLYKQKAQPIFKNLIWFISNCDATIMKAYKKNNYNYYDISIDCNFLEEMI